MKGYEIFSNRKRYESFSDIIRHQGIREFFTDIIRHQEIRKFLKDIIKHEGNSFFKFLSLKTKKGQETRVVSNKKKIL